MKDQRTLLPKKPRSNAVSFITHTLVNYGVLVHYVYILLVILDDNNIVWRQCAIAGFLGRYTSRSSSCVSACTQNAMRDHIMAFPHRDYLNWTPGSDMMHACHTACTDYNPAINIFKLVRILSLGLLAVYWDPIVKWYRICPSGLAYLLQPDCLYSFVQTVTAKIFPSWFANHIMTDVATITGFHAVSIFHPGVFSPYYKAHAITVLYFTLLMIIVFCSKALFAVTLGLLLRRRNSIKCSSVSLHGQPCTKVSSSE